MERIKLTNREKRVLRLLRDGCGEALSEFDAPSVARLNDLGLVMRSGIEDGGFEDARLTTMGKEYLNDNPHLRNPVDWKLVFTAIAAVAAVLALFISCIKR